MRAMVSLALAAALGWPVTTWAAEPKRVLVQPLRVDGDVKPGWTPQLAEGVSEGLERGEFEVVEGNSAPCDTPACFVSAAESGPADFVVQSSVAAGADRTYTVSLQLIDGATGEVVVEVREVCDLCSVSEVRELLADQSATLRTKMNDLVKGAPVSVIEASPSGANILIDGEAVGASPLRREVLAGRHIVRAEVEGYAPLERDVLAVDGAEETIVLTLSPLPEPQRNLRPLAWVGLGVGVAGVAAGATFFVLDGRPAPGDRCAGNNVDMNGNCRFRYDTIGEAIGVMAAGVVVTVASAVALGLTSKRRRRKQAASLQPYGAGFRF